MSTLRKAHLGLGFALLAAVGFGVGCAATDVPSDDATVGETAEAFSIGCTMSGPPGERADALLTILPRGRCRRDRTGIPGDVTVPSCHEVAASIGCFLVN